MTSYPCNKYEQITPSYHLSVKYIFYIAGILCDNYKEANRGNFKYHDGLKDCFIVKTSTKISRVPPSDWFYVIFLCFKLIA